MNDPDLLTAAMAAAGYESTRRFAADVLDVDPRTARRWKAGKKDMLGTARVVCVAIVARPELAAELAAARATLPPAPGVLDAGDDVDDV